ncbi:MAG: MerR family DNA-binding transcriptional regulator, partial [Planctomycetes bacterium]|nr:MerR family DNA-binding transcriptional regulator [Planctomycetota bacterium]
ELPLILTAGDLAAFLGVSIRTLRRWNQLGEIPDATNRTWDRDEIQSWVAAGRPERDVWERIKSKR